MNTRLPSPGRPSRRPPGPRVTSTRGPRGRGGAGARALRARLGRVLRSPSTVGALVLILLTGVGAVAVATSHGSTGLRASVQASGVWLATGPRGSLTRVEAATGRPTAMLYPWEEDEVPDDGFAVAGSTLLVLDADGRLVVWDQAGAAGAGTVELPPELHATRVAADAAHLHLVGEHGTVETRPLARADRPGRRTTLPGTAEQVLAVGDTLWVRLAGTGAVVGVRDGDLVTGPHRCAGPCTLLAADGQAHLASGSTATGLGGADDWALPGDADPGRLRPEPGTATAVLAGDRIIEYGTGKARRSSPLPDAAGDGAPLIVGDHAYLPTSDGAVLVLPLNGTAGTRVPVAGPGPVELEPAGLLVLAHDPASDRVVVIDGIRAHTGSKYDTRVPVIGDGPRALADPAAPAPDTPAPEEQAPAAASSPAPAPIPVQDPDPSPEPAPRASGPAVPPSPAPPGPHDPAAPSPASPAAPPPGDAAPQSPPAPRDPAPPAQPTPQTPTPKPDPAPLVPADPVPPPTITAPQVTAVTAGPGWIEVDYRLDQAATVTEVTASATAPDTPPATLTVPPGQTRVRLAVGPCRRYQVTVTAVGPAGTSSAPPVPAVACAPLAPPAALAAVPVGGDRVQVSWQPPAGVGAVTHRILAAEPVPHADPAGTLLSLPPASLQQITVVAEDSTGRTSQVSTQVHTLPARVGVCERTGLPVRPDQPAQVWAACAPAAGDFTLFRAADPGHGITVPVYRQRSRDQGGGWRLVSDQGWSWPAGGTWDDVELLGYAADAPAPWTEAVHRWERVAGGITVYFPDRLDPNRSGDTFNRTGTVLGAR